MKHWQRPQITIGTRHPSVEERADRIHPGIAMGDHHTLRTRSRAARVIDREQIDLVNFGTNKFSRARVDHCFIVEPALGFSCKSDEVFNLGKLFANTVDRSKVIAVRADHARTTMIDQINEVVGREPIV
jgi:hypothetical protein